MGKYKGANGRNIALTSCRVAGHILLQAASKRNSQKQSQHYYVTPSCPPSHRRSPHIPLLLHSDCMALVLKRCFGVKGCYWYWHWYNDDKIKFNRCQITRLILMGIYVQC